ncbi:predicted protein [Plenodomus lingam JN3]|uniref:Predicted protein n=1 Tax=Leptosphaeria maculans (strain JN3 / isolate v23.1.3 / race Av1-4-5-6-7-8) TaxID=985895 RepID=E5A2N9_LEPMJ|nr:predicted protein [Plenodomus lingam JN3]CBX97835.1 predicted protein [Plenodomus lingam JN3]
MVGQAFALPHRRELAFGCTASETPTSKSEDRTLASNASRLLFRRTRLHCFRGLSEAGLGSTLSYQLPCQQPIRVLHLTADIEII